MNDLRQNIHRAFLILNSLLIPVFILFFIEILNSPFLLKLSFLFIFLVIAPLKIYCMSGISGCVLEIISGEEYVLRLQRVHQNALRLWPGFLAVFVIIRLIDFLLFAFLPFSHIWRTVYLCLMGTIAAFVLARWIVKKKYVEPLGLSVRRFKFELNFILVIIIACCAELALVGILDFIHWGGIHWRHVLAFMLNYINVFEFIFCALYIVGQYPEIISTFNHSQEVFLINPMGTEVVQSIGFWSIRCYPPVFVVLKALSPKTYKFREFNQVLWHERYYRSKALVCITCFTSNCCEAYKIAKEFKKRGSSVIMGGPHVTYLPQEALAFCDSVVIGPAEGVWKQVLRDYEKGRLRSEYKGPASEADYAQVHTELLNSTPSIARSFLETTRGCKFRCHFCTIPALTDGQVRVQAINDMVDLIKKIKVHDRNIRFIDSNIYSDPGYARELFGALKPLNVRWQSSCTIDIAKNEETLKLARESGCDRLSIGYEISGGSLEKNQGGKFAMAQKYLEYTKLTKKTGIKIKGLFIFGFDSDSYSTLIKLWKFCFSVMPQFSVLSILTPLPGSGVYRDMLAQERIINLNWRSYGLIRMVVRHPQMDHRLVSFFFPLIQTFFFLTTSSGGIMLLVFCYVIPLWVSTMTFR